MTSEEFDDIKKKWAKAKKKAADEEREDRERQQEMMVRKMMKMSLFRANIRIFPSFFIKISAPMD